MFKQKKIDWDRVKMKLPTGSKLRGKWAQIHPREVYEFIVGEILPTRFSLPETRADLSLAGQALTVFAWEVDESRLEQTDGHLVVIQTGTTTKIIPRLYVGRMLDGGIPAVTGYEALYATGQDGDVRDCISRLWRSSKTDKMLRQGEKLLAERAVLTPTQTLLYTAARHGIIPWSRLGFVDKDVAKGTPILEAGIKQILRAPIVKQPEANYLWTHLVFGKSAEKQKESA